MTKGQAHDVVLKACWAWAQENDFRYVPTPRMVRATGACENVDTLWEVHADGITGGKTTSAVPSYFFAQTGQLYLEMALAQTPKVFTLGSSGRAEATVDHRHLREFTLFEVEGQGGFQTLVKTINSLFWRIDQEIEGLGKSSSTRKGLPFVLRSYSQLVDDFGLTWGDDFSHTQEMDICKKHGGPVLLTHHPDPQPPGGEQAPELEKFFNMKPDPMKDPAGRSVVQSCDLLLPIAGECLGGAVRLHDADLLQERLLKSRMFGMLQARGLGLEQFEGYLEHIREHSEEIGEHFGFGVGIDRVVQSYLEEPDIRRAAAFLVI